VVLTALLCAWGFFFVALDVSTTGRSVVNWKGINFGGVRFRMRSDHEILMVGRGLSHVESTNREDTINYEWRKVETGTYTYAGTIWKLW
jgi:hypothetical protein